MATRIPAYLKAQTEIKRYIEANGLSAGDALPPEAVLANQLKISRPSLRESIKALEALGVIETRHGEGMFVSAFSFNAILQNLPYSLVVEGNNLRNLLQVRSAIELGVTANVVQKIGTENLSQLRSLAQRMLLAAQSGQGFEAEDREFHAVLYRCLDNPFLSQLIDLFWQVFQRLNMSDVEAVNHWASESTAQDHLEIVDMLARRDKLGFASTMRKHFEDISGRLVGENDLPLVAQPPTI